MSDRPVRTTAPFWVIAVILIYILQQGSQLAMTPLGEGMDSAYHWAYMVYLSNEGKIPLPGQVSVPATVARLAQAFPGPDPTLGDRYAQWASLTPDQRQAVKTDALAPVGLNQYTLPNYESQHPPLYYSQLSIVYPAVRNLPLDQQFNWLALISVLVSALALPAIYLTFRIYFGSAPSVLILLLLVWFPNLMPFLGRITNDTLSFAIAAWLVYFCLSPRRSMVKAYRGRRLAVYRAVYQKLLSNPGPALPGHSRRAASRTRQNYRSVQGPGRRCRHHPIRDWRLALV